MQKPFSREVGVLQESKGGVPVSTCQLPESRRIPRSSQVCPGDSVVTGLEGRKALFWSQQLHVPALCQAPVYYPPGASTQGARSRRPGNAAFLISGAVIRAGKDWPVALKKKSIFPILPVYTILVPQVTETPILLSLFNLHFTSFLPYLPSGQLWT